VKLSIRSGGVRLDIFKIYEIILVLKTEGNKIETYGDPYTSMLPALGVFAERKAAEIMYKFEFEFQSRKKTFVYKILSGSIKPYATRNFQGGFFIVKSSRTERGNAGYTTKQKLSLKEIVFLPLNNKLIIMLFIVCFI
jgi:hypothetical protein